jgi:hypothetical protein
VIQNRECHPLLCKNCCCDVDLKKAKSSEGKIDFCPNTGVTFGYKARLLLGKSNICDGLGLFAAERIRKGDYIGKYIGELISEEE